MNPYLIAKAGHHDHIRPVKMQLTYNTTINT